MSEDIKPEIIKNTQKTLGKYIKKPVLTEKLLKKPPFRFLHDIIKAVIKETGFLKGLFNEHELNSDNVKDKDAKINFLNKLIDAVSKYIKPSNFGFFKVTLNYLLFMSTSNCIPIAPTCNVINLFVFNNSW